MAGDDRGAALLSADDADYILRDGRFWPGPARPAAFTGRPSAGIVYDPGRGVFVACGSSGGGTFDETWELAGGAWRKVAVPGPPERNGYALAHDAIRGVTVLMGGSSTSGELGDTWLYDGAAWSEDTGVSPGPRVLHAMAFDAARGMLVMFGGSGDGSLGDTWLRDGQGWRRASPPVSPTPRWRHSMAYHAGLAKVVLRGGMESALLRDAWTFDGSTWQQEPWGLGGCGATAAAVASVGDAVVSWGGDDHLAHGPMYCYELRELGLSGWSRVAERPGGSGAAVSSGPGGVLLFGGLRIQGFIQVTPQESFLYRGDSWVRGPVAPLRVWTRYGHAMAHDAARDRVVLYGGNADEEGEDTWEVDGNGWILGPPGTGTVGVRSGHARAYDERRGRVVLVGGGDTADVWEYDGASWRAGAPPPLAFGPRQGLAMTYDGREQRSLIFGGSNGQTSLGDTWLYDGTTWEEHVSTSGPAARSGAGMAFDARRAASLLVGGSPLRDAWSFDALGWHRLPDAPSLLPPMGFVSAAYDATRGVVVAVAYVPSDAQVTLELGDPVATWITGAGCAAANPNRVRLHDAWGRMGASFDAYAPGHWGAVVATARVGSASEESILSAPGPGAVLGPHVRGFAPSGTPLPGLSFYAYGTLRYGANVGAGDLDGAGQEEIVTGPGPGAVFGPHLRAFRYGGTAVATVSWVNTYAYGTLEYGANLAGGDLDLDGSAELLAGPGPGASFAPHVKGFDVDGAPARPMPGVSFHAFGTTGHGVRVASGDVTGDGRDDVLGAQGAGPSMTARARGFDVPSSGATLLPGFDVVAFPTLYGVIAAAGHVTGGPTDELLAGAGPDPAAASTTETFLYDGAALVATPGGFDAFPGLAYGVNVTSGHVGL